jgi:hypothetical protein
LWQGFRDFVLRFMLRMSRDFALPSLVVTDESLKGVAGSTNGEAEVGYEIKSKWENEPHPYLFFNDDG